MSSPYRTRTTANGGALKNNYIEHQVSKMDTLAGVAIKYGVEVADIKRMNGLATDIQMFALKSLHIPLLRRHPPASHTLSNGSTTSRESSTNTPVRLGNSNAFESFQSRRIKSPQQKVSPAMNTLQNYYGLLSPSPKDLAEETEMAVYSAGKLDHFDNGLRHKVSPNPGYSTPERLLKEEIGGSSSGSGSGSGSSFSAVTGKGLALRPKSASRSSLIADTELRLGDPLMTGVGVHRSLSTPSLQDQEGNNFSSVWLSSKTKWSLKQDLQSLSTASIARPIFDGLPNPITGRRNKAALD